MKGNIDGEKMRLKLWVKIALFILITGTLSVIVFQMGRNIGMEIARENMQKLALENELLAENEVEEEVVPVEEEPYVIDLLKSEKILVTSKTN